MGYQKHSLIILISLVLTRLISGSEAPESNVIAPHCTSECGGIAIPYPFGIEEGCYYRDKDDHSLYPSMRITCNRTFSHPKPIYGKDIDILNISLKRGEIRLNNDVSYNCREPNNSAYGVYTWINVRNFTISSRKNKFVATGCDTYAWFKGKRYGKNYSTGCMTTCNELDDVANDNICNGVGCCEASLPDGVTNVTIAAYSLNNHIDVEFNPCSVAYPVAKDAFYFSTQNLTQNLSYYLNEQPSTPIIYNWGIGTKNCSEAEKEESRFLCKNNTNCINLTHEQNGLDGYRCSCKEGYSGNPYLPQGCQAFTEDLTATRRPNENLDYEEISDDDIEEVTATFVGSNEFDHVDDFDMLSSGCDFDAADKNDNRQIGDLGSDEVDDRNLGYED